MHTITRRTALAVPVTLPLLPVSAFTFFSFIRRSAIAAFNGLSSSP